MDRERLKGFAQKVFEDMAGAMTAGLVYVGTRTGLFRAMDGRGAMTLDEVVETSGLERRYVEEWLAGMTAAGYLDYDAGSRTFALPSEHGYLLASEGTDHYAGGLFAMVPALLAVAPRVAEAFRHGGGVAFDEFGPHCVEALDLVNRGNYEHRLVSYWLQSMPDVVQRLEQGGRALDFGCGAGMVSLSLADAFPASRFIGVDIDAASIEVARRAAAEAGVAGAVDFRHARVEDMAAGEIFDLITACDCVHDLTTPVETLAALRERLATDGTMLVIEPRASDRLEDNVHPIGAMFYGFSVFHCMTQSLAGGGPGLGTCMGPSRTEALMREAGFGRFETLDIKSQVNLFYAVGH